MMKLKDKPMAFQIWIILGLVLGLSFILVTGLSPVVLRYSFTNETYARIIESQEYFIEYIGTDEIKKDHPLFIKLKDDEGSPPFRIVRHILLPENGVIHDSELSAEILGKIKNEALNQTENIKNYVKKIENIEVFYVIRRLTIGGERGYLISFLGQRYRDNLVESTFNRLIRLIIFILLISWIASIAIAKYLTRPLIELQSRVKDIAQRKWEKSVSLDRGDEIGKLGETIDQMRLQLMEQDQKQQSFLQQISHELKTPIMVIRSYVQSINDGIFPRGNMESSLEIIEEETERLEKRVHFLLNYTKYEYLVKQQLEEVEFDLAELIKKVSNNFIWYNSEISWEMDIQSTIIIADQEKFRIALENLFDNQIRYAEETIKVSLNNNKDSRFQFTKDESRRVNRKHESNNVSLVLRIWNDGPELKPDIIDNIFNKFKKGYEGNFGLGLAIVKLIVELHGGDIWVNNEDDGVAFYIKILVDNKH